MTTMPTTTNKNCVALPVIVVGAGISGAATAYELRQHGCNVRVLEAAHIAGGRTRVIDDSPFPFIWIHGTHNNPITNALIRFGFQDHIRYSGGDSSFIGNSSAAFWFTYDANNNGTVQEVAVEEVDETFDLIDEYYYALGEDIEGYFANNVPDVAAGPREFDIPVALGERTGEYLVDFFNNMTDRQSHLVDYLLRFAYDDDWGLSRNAWSFYHADQWWMNDYGIGDYEDGTFSEDSMAGCAPDHNTE